MYRLEGMYLATPEGGLKWLKHGLYERLESAIIDGYKVIGQEGRYKVTGYLAFRVIDRQRRQVVYFKER